ncbi:hypothetical protein C5167_002688 [Papaver somniferum]|uniref:Uncharacterized protein n=1 Tax=Papaver somniferum TaxID=3469 RepID=A0A4Y7L243_PAPSO|nr:hypothetical protein C5167_002688 [Papaver somniferum]
MLKCEVKISCIPLYILDSRLKTKGMYVLLVLLKVQGKMLILFSVHIHT